MKKLKIYLDTSVINFLFADDVPEFRKITREFFEMVKAGKNFEVYISDVVINEGHSEKLSSLSLRAKRSNLASISINMLEIASSQKSLLAMTFTDFSECPEITKTSDARKRSRLLSIIDNYYIIRLPNDKDFEVGKLAETYLRKVSYQR